MALKLVVPGLVGLYGLAVVASRRRSRRAEAWAARAAKVHPRATLLDEGREGVGLDLAGLEVRALLLDGLVEGGGTAFELTVPAPLPPALDMRRQSLLFGDHTPEVRVAMGPALSGFVVRSLDAAWARRTLAQTAVRRALLAVDGLGSLVLSAGVLRMVRAARVEPHRIDEDAAVLAGLGRALADAATAAWRQAAPSHGLSFAVEGPRAMQLGAAGQPVALRFETDGAQVVGEQVLRIRLAGRVPDTLRLRRRRPGAAPGQPLGDLILDRGLRASGGGADLGARLGRDAVRGPLLDFLHGDGAPVVREGHLELRAAGGGTPVLLGRLDDLRHLAGALEAAWR